MDWPTATIVMTVVATGLGIVWKVFLSGNGNGHSKKSDELELKIEMSAVREILLNVREDIAEIKKAQERLVEKDEKTNERIDKLATLTIQHIQTGE